MSTTDATRTTTLPVDLEALRASVREKYGVVATAPQDRYHFHTGRPLARLLGYDPKLVDHLPDRAVESFAGVADLFAIHPLGEGDDVVDLGSGGGFDCFVAAQLVGPTGTVTGVDMTDQMLDKARGTARELGVENVFFVKGIIEDLPLPDASTDVVIANGVLNLVADKPRAFAEAYRILRPGGRLQFSDIAVGRDVPEAATCDIDLWTDCIAGGQSVEQWRSLIEGAGFSQVLVGPGVDTFGGAPGERRARQYEVAGHAFWARKPQ